MLGEVLISGIELHRSSRGIQSWAAGQGPTHRFEIDITGGFHRLLP
jgi:hypothetical protein